ncbi:MAG: CARDB domain-containing protein [Thermoplasmata archaeon]
MNKNKSNTVQKLMSAFILWCLVAGGLLGVLTTQVGSGAEPEQPAPSFLPATIAGYVELRDRIYNASYALDITGTLKLVNTTLNFLQDGSTDFYIHVNGGNLILENSTITTGATPVAAWDPLFEIEFDGGMLEMTRNSVLAFPGWLNMTNALVYVNDSWITGLKPADIPADYPERFTTFLGVVTEWWRNPMWYPVGLTDPLNDGPIMSFVNCEATIADSRIDELYENSEYTLPTYTVSILPDNVWTNGTGNRANVISEGDGYISLNGYPQTIFVDDFNTSSLIDESWVFLQSVVLNVVYTNPDYTTLPAYEFNDNFYYSVPGDFSNRVAFPIEENQTTNYYAYVDLLSYVNTVNSISQLNVSYTSHDDNAVSGVDSFLIDLIQLDVTYSFLTQPTSIYLDATDMTVMNSYIGVDWADDSIYFGRKNAFNLVNNSNLYLYGTSICWDEAGVGQSNVADFLEIPPSTDPADYPNYMPFRTYSGSEVYFYKWNEVTVVDKYGKAVEGALVDAAPNFTNTTLVDMVAAINDHADYADATWVAAKTRATDYMERVYGVAFDELSITGANGRAMIPMLTTFINQTNYPNGDHVGEYDLNVSFGTNYTYAVGDFMPFPNTQPAHNLIQVPVSLDGLALERPFGSTGLIVNATTGSLFRGGDGQPYPIDDFIVVEDSETLTITDALVSMRYSGSAPFHIIVRDSARLVLNNVALTSDSPITIHVMDDASLSMSSSSTGANPAVSIIAYDNANVTLNKATLGGYLGTAPDANVTLWASSTSFGQALSDFTGTSKAYLIGCYPSIEISPSEQAEVWIYRWAEITVVGGLTNPVNPLANANVWLTSNYTQLSRNGVTNSTGVYRVPLLSDYLRYDPYSEVVVPFYCGFYSALVQYRLDPSTPLRTKTFSIGLSKYPAMTQNNDATYKTTVVLGDVLPDLTPTAFTIEPLEANNTVGRGNKVWFNATISNLGDAKATNVVVQFIDDRVTTPIQFTNLSMGPLTHWNISFVHSWDYSTDRGLHNITLKVDPFNTVKEYDETNNEDYIDVTVLSRPDLAIRYPATDVWADAYPLVNRSFNIYARVWNNLGDIPAENVTVSFHDLTLNRLLGEVPLLSVPNGESSVVATLTLPATTFTVNNTYSIFVAIDEANEIQEVNEDNNNNSASLFSLRVYQYPDLAITSLEVIEGTSTAVIFAGGGTPITETNNRTMVTLRARVLNQGELHATNVYVDFYDGTTFINRSSNTIVSITSGNSGYAILVWEARTTDLQQVHNLRAIARAAGVSDSDPATRTLTVYDNRPDLAITDIVLANNATHVTDGNPFYLNVTFTNNGIGDAHDVVIQVYASEEDWNATTLLRPQGRLNNTEIATLEAGETMTLSMRCSSIVAGTQRLFVVVDPDFNSTDTIPYDGITPIYGDIEEYSELNNNATLSVLAIMPQLRIILQLPAIGGNVFTEGEQSSILITGLVVRVDNPSQGVRDIPIVIDAGTGPVTVISGDGGFFTTYLAITQPGNYTLRASGDDISEVQSWFRIDVEEIFPWWIIILIIIIVVAVILGITAYLYFVGLGKTVQCGECGAFIPEGAAKCPKCGVEFETEVAKCSVCGAWVPIDVKNCPDCGTEFTVGTEDLEDYEAKMKRQFEDVVRKFREKAKQELGPEFTETEFQAWWAKQPTFITFDQWLKEEEEMKRMGSRPCPVCEMENSVTAKICHKCGSVMGESEKAPPKKPEGKMPPAGKAPEAAKPAAAPAQQAQAPPKQQAAPPAQTPAAAAPAGAAQQPAAAPAPAKPAQPGKKGCPSCGMEVGVNEKACPICSYTFPETPGGGDATRRIIRKPIKKIVRKPGEGGGDQQQSQ